jgi:protein-arginine kinase activator protein McsA
VGKIPPSASPEARLAVLGTRADQLRTRLKAAVLREEYETAAELRDKLAGAEAELLRHLDDSGETRRAGGGPG